MGQPDRDVEDGVGAHRDTRVRLLTQLLWGCAVALMLGGSLAGCSFTSTSGPTNENPLSYLRNDIQAAGITSIEGSQDGKDGLYLTVLAPEGQDASAVADELVSLTQKYRKELDVRWLYVIIESTEGTYRHTFDLNSSPSSTS